MRRNSLKILFTLTGLLVAAPLAHGSSVQLHSVQFPEKTPVQLSFNRTPIAPSARIMTEITYKRGQGRIDLYYQYMKPAILFGGDVTCYVVWAVTRDGRTQNLGELLTRRMSGKLEFSTGNKDFALMVTAESFYLVNQPSELVVFSNDPSSTEVAESTPFTFDRFVPAPRHSMDAITHIKWDSKVPLELLQARKAFELAGRYDAPVHSGQVYTEAEAALQSANQIATIAPRSRELLDSARKAVALSNTALNISMRRVEAIEMEKQLARRREETAELERRAMEAETAARDAERLAEQVRSEAEHALTEKKRMLAETAALRTEKSALESAMMRMREEKRDLKTSSARLRGEKATLERESQRLIEEKAAMAKVAERLRKEKAGMAREAERLRQEKAAVEDQTRRLQQEKDQLTGRLKSALSHVADTRESARGLVVNLPDILFDLNEATLKPETQLVLSKLAGILLILPEQGAVIEGHTDSTGSPKYNIDLSKRRATAVLQFLYSQGLDPRRLKAVGHGMTRPIADNSTRGGRQRNRRVEIVISEGERKIASK